MTARPQHVLLLEDDPLMQRFVSYALEDFEVVLTCCNSVAQALDAFFEQSFDVFVLLLSFKARNVLKQCLFNWTTVFFA